MKFQEKTHFTFQLFLLVCVAKVKSDISTVHVGDDAILNCIHSIENFTLVTWTVDFLNQSSCYMSTIGQGPEGNCSHQMRLDTDKNRTYLRIHNVEVLNEGSYTCQIVNNSGTYFYTVPLQVLVKPFVSLNIDKNGHPECRAIGGKPAANISWAPETTDRVKTWSNTELNRTITVTSSYNTSNGTEVTCIVSHPSFSSAVERRLSRLALGAGANNLILIVGVIIVLVLLLGLILLWKRSNLRICLSVKNDSPTTEENPAVIVEEVEPYASFTEKVNTIYNSTYDYTDYKGPQRTGQKT